MIDVKIEETVQYYIMHRPKIKNTRQDHEWQMWYQLWLEEGDCPTIDDMIVDMNNLVEHQKHLQFKLIRVTATTKEEKLA